MSRFELDEEEIAIPKKDYKKEIDEEIRNKFNENTELQGINLLDLKENKKTKKGQVTLYIDDEDLKVLKTIAHLKKTTLNKVINEFIRANVRATKGHLPEELNIDKMAKEYDKRNKNKGPKK
ncbi:hypothetical protein CDFC105_73137 [Clostridioides difficile]|nr:hypothetical protein CDFC105_60646 [Clostridioides difficile]CZR95930.1 hypothetical protein CDFC105_60719 [Clostridioides difficile]CZS09255.1 hypothetical protein CDFC105_73064 [Clostridioides difficile]CZS09445.1 hypothetical protein CDFC105_73137 [Clostridioides difficile]